MSYALDTRSKNQLKSWFWIAIRIAVGAILMLKGINFVRDTYVLETLTGQHSEGIFTEIESGVIGLAMLLIVVGGLLMIVGVFTPVVSIVLLLLFSIGLLFLHGGYIERSGFELALTLAIPFLLLVFIAPKIN